MVARRVPARAKKQPGLRVGTKITSGQKAQFKHYEKNRVRQKNEGRKMKVARFAQRRGVGYLIFLPRIFLTFSSSSREPELVFVRILTKALQSCREKLQTSNV
jgi:hypothetical protein